MDIISILIGAIVIGILIGIIILPTYIIQNLKKNENTKKFLKKEFLWADVQSFLYGIMLLIGTMIVIFLFTSLGDIIF